MTDKLINEYREKTLKLDFKQIKLTQLGDTDKEVFVGPGHVEQTSEGFLIYKLYHNSEVSLSETLRRLNGVKAGELVPEDYYFSFEGIDMSNRKWFSDRIEIDFHATKNFTVVHEKLEELKTNSFLRNEKKNEKKGQFHQIWIPKKINLPSNLTTFIQHFVGDDEMKSIISNSAAEYENSFMKLLLFHEEDWMVIRFKVHDDTFHPFIFERVLCALQFILVEPMNWVMYRKRIKSDYTMIFNSYPDEFVKARFNEPIRISSRNENKIWGLFDSYLKYILFNKEDPIDPISQVISKCLIGSEGSSDAFSLTLSLAVEEMLNTIFKDLKIEKSIKEKDITLLKSSLKSLDIEKSFKDRINSFIGHIQQTTASDRLRYLVETTPVTRGDYDCWKAIRNYFAHPDDSNLKTQEKVDKTYTVLTLLYKLIFIKIEYQGHYNDYGERGWPMKKWSNGYSNRIKE